MIQGDPVSRHTSESKKEERKGGENMEGTREKWADNGYWVFIDPRPPRGSELEMRAQLCLFCCLPIHIENYKFTLTAPVLPHHRSHFSPTSLLDCFISL